jgi:hypothetical protein
MTSTLHKEASKQQIKAVNAILAAKGLMHDKAHIISNATNGRTEHSSALYFEEAQILLAFLTREEKEKSNVLMLRKLFAMAHEMNWITQKTVVHTDGSLRPGNDYSAVYAWVKKYSPWKKDLNKHTYEELTKLVSQFEFGPYAHHLKK